MQRPKQIGEREEVIGGQRVKVRVFEPFMPAPDADADAVPVRPRRKYRDDSSGAGQEFIRATNRRAAQTR